jgi:cytoskeletal protein CcmA (bactofilin family)
MRDENPRSLRGMSFACEPCRPEAAQMDCARIGQTIQITGEISAEEPLIVEGKVVGSIELTGHPLTITENGTVEATVVAHTITVSGHVTGTLSASARIVVQQTATIDGDLEAPAVSVQEGAVMHGRLQIEGRRQGLALAS